MPLEVLTPDSPRWRLFCSALTFALTDGMQEGQCRCGDDGSAGSAHRYTRIVLTEMGKIDIPCTLESFRERGGYCDCEVLLNIVEPSERSGEEIRQ